MPAPRPGYKRFWGADVPKHLMTLAEKIRKHKGHFKGAFVVNMLKEYVERHKSDLPAEEPKV